MTSLARRLAILRSPRELLLSLAYVAGYVALDWVSSVFPVSDATFTAWNPPPGLSLVFLLRNGVRRWPWLFVAALAAEFLVRNGRTPLVLALAIAALLSLAYAGLARLLRFFRFDPDFPTLRDTFLFVPSVAVVTLGVATVFVYLQSRLGDLEGLPVATALLHYWVGDLIGITITSPFLLVVTRGHLPRKNCSRPETVLQGLAIVAALALVFGPSIGDELRIFYVLFVPLIWIAMREGLPGTSIGVFGIQLALLVSLFAGGNSAVTLAEFQGLMAVLAITGLVLGAAVSERNAGVAQLAAREQELRTVLRTAPDGILTISGSQRVTSVNPAAARLFRAADTELVGRPLESLLDRVPVLADPPPHPTVATRADGSRFPVEVSIGAAPEWPGQTVAVVRDMTARRAIERALREKQRELDRTLRLAAASETASALAHELNQPLAAIANYVRASQLLLDRGAGADEVRAAMGKAVAEVARAGEVMHRLREFFKSGTIHHEVLDILTLVGEAVEAVQPRLQRHEIACRIDCPRQLPKIWGDSVQLGIVLHNLLANAVDALKGDTRQSIRRIDISARPYGDHHVRITIADNGPGVPPAVAGELFQPFASSKPEGMGLGLAISRSIVEAHSGELRHEATAAGCAFSLTVPLAEVTR